MDVGFRAVVPSFFRILGLEDGHIPNFYNSFYCRAKLRRLNNPCKSPHLGVLVRPALDRALGMVNYPRLPNVCSTKGLWPSFGGI